MAQHQSAPYFGSAATLTLEALADLFTRSFEGYLYPGLTSPEVLAQRIRLEQIDLWHSRVLFVHHQPAGIALIGLRGNRGWCGGFGITMPYRGCGLAAALTEAMLSEARIAGAMVFTLEVLTRNKRALRVYSNAGFQIKRDLLIVEWRQPNDVSRPEPHLAHLTSHDSHTLLKYYSTLHTIPSAWQRELITLLGHRDLCGLALPSEQPTAYVLYQHSPTGILRIKDFAALDHAQAQALLNKLQTHSAHIVSVNEPTDSLTTSAFAAAGFAEIDRQHEMLIEL